MGDCFTRYIFVFIWTKTCRHFFLIFLRQIKRYSLYSKVWNWKQCLIKTSSFIFLRCFTNLIFYLYAKRWIYIFRTKSTQIWFFSYAKREPFTQLTLACLKSYRVPWQVHREQVPEVRSNPESMFWPARLPASCARNFSF